MKTGFYVDGFNLYHAIDALHEPTLKWLNIRSLAQSYMKDGDELARVVFFTAVNTWDAGKRARHVNYTNALSAIDVEVVLSRFDKVQKHCLKFDRWCRIREEKQTDVAIATEVIADCYDNKVNRVMLVTADSDQIPMVSRLRRKFPHNIFMLLAPPNRLNNARELGKACTGILEISPGRLRGHLLDETIRDAKGKLVATRPALYSPHFP